MCMGRRSAAVNAADRSLLDGCSQMIVMIVCVCVEKEITPSGQAFTGISIVCVCAGGEEGDRSSEGS